MNSQSRVLVVDAGNSFTKAGYFIDGKLGAVSRFPTDKYDIKMYEDELLAWLSSDYDINLTDEVIVSSVVPQIKPAIDKAFKNKNIIWIESKEINRLNLGAVDFSQYADGELGTDRILNIIAAYNTFPGKKLLVCDFGTTATFDLLDGAIFLGGAISPGARKFQSLVDSNHAAQLFMVDIFRKPDLAIGKSTKGSLENGLYYGYKGAVLGIINALVEHAGWPLSEVTMLFTGGDAENLQRMVESEIPNLYVDSALTLKGLYLIWEFNRQLVK